MSYAHRVFNASDGLPNAGAYEAANEADAEIQRLRTQLAESKAACAAYRAALEEIANDTRVRDALNALDVESAALSAEIKDCPHCAKWRDHPCNSFCCESGTPNHYGKLKSIEKRRDNAWSEEVKRYRDKDIARQALGSNPGKAVGDVIAALEPLFGSGNALSNLAYNISQPDWPKLRPDELPKIRKLADDWDAARRAARAALARLEGRE